MDPPTALPKNWVGENSGRLDVSLLELMVGALRECAQIELEIMGFKTHGVLVPTVFR